LLRLDFISIEEMCYYLVQELLINSILFGQVEIKHILGVTNTGKIILIKIDEVKQKLMNIWEKYYSDKMTCNYDKRMCLSCIIKKLHVFLNDKEWQIMQRRSKQNVHASLS